MNPPIKKPPAMKGILQPFEQPARRGHQFKPAVAQLKNATRAHSVKRPVAPPVYRPAGKSEGAPLKLNPAAPPSYRPQPLTRVLQKKASDSLQTKTAQARHAAVAPPAFRPQSVSKLAPTVAPATDPKNRPAQSVTERARALQLQLRAQRPWRAAFGHSSAIQRSSESKTDKFKRFKTESTAVSSIAHKKSTDMHDQTVKNLNKVKSKMYSIEETEIVADDSFRTIMNTWATQSDSNKEAWDEYGKSLKAYREDQEKIKKEEQAKKAKPVTYSQACEDVFADMESKFAAWNGSRQTRGAWWGATTPGSPNGAKNVDTSVILELKKKCGNTGWVFSDSLTGGLSFHRNRPNNTESFIYHMQTPPS